MTCVARLLLVLALLAGLLSAPGGAALAAPGGCGGDRLAMADVCLAPGMATPPAQIVGKGCAACTLPPGAAFDAPPRGAGLLALRPATDGPARQADVAPLWRPPRG